MTNKLIKVIMKSKQKEKELILLVYDTIESFPTVNIFFSKQFWKLIRPLFLKKKYCLRR
jgi:hypothetical protein